jgi:MoaA/NifB/PqqE/SkfB family radical SAM enzyme
MSFLNNLSWSMVTDSVRESEDQGCRFRRIKKPGIRVGLDVTGQCNLRCRHCFACLEEKQLDTGQLLAIVDQLRDIEAHKIILTGGEPLLRQDLEQVVELAVSQNLGVDVNTNLSPLSHKRACLLRRAGLDEISTSIDGMSEYHDWFRRAPGDFNRVVAGIQLAIDLGFNVDVHGVCTGDNLADSVDVIDLCAELGVSSFTLLAVVPRMGSGGRCNTQFQLTPRDKLALKQILLRKRAEYGQQLPIRTVDIFQHPTCEECTMSEQVAGITPTGKVLPCLLAKYTPGAEENLENHRLSDVWEIVQKRTRNEGKKRWCTVLNDWSGAKNST